MVQLNPRSNLNWHLDRKLISSRVAASKVELLPFQHVQLFINFAGDIKRSKYNKNIILLKVNSNFSHIHVYSTKGVYREEGMQLTMTVRTQQTLYQIPDMLKIESSIRT